MDMKKWMMFSLLIVAALIWASCERKITDGDQQQPDEGTTLSCLECHSDGSGPQQGIVNQFVYSVHASGDHTDRNRLTSSGYVSCERCHTSEGFVAYVTGIPADGDHFSSFDCFTCHEPHSNGDFRVRVTDAYTLENGATFNRGNANTCATCHHSRRDVREYVVDGALVNSRWGPHHSNQSDMLIGENAYEYAEYDYSLANSWHQTGVTNGCVACHMSASQHESIGGHSWNMRNEERGFENTTGCNVDGCHSTNPVASINRETVFDFDGDGVREGVQTEIHDIVDSLAVVLVKAGLLDEDHVPTTFEASSADSAGALYNFLFIQEDRSFGVHNTRYAVALLESSINFLNTGDPNGSPSDRSTRMLSAH
jgi:hypothetical protein